MWCVCISPLPKPHSVPDRYMRFPHTTSDNSHLLSLCSIPSGSLHFTSCPCIRPLSEPHSMPNSYMRLPPSSSLPSGYLLIYMYIFICVLAHGTCPNSTVYPVVFYITPHVLTAGTCPNCTLYPVVTTLLPEIFKLLSTLLFYCRMHEHNIVLFFFFIHFFFFD